MKIIKFLLSLSCIALLCSCTPYAKHIDTRDWNKATHEVVDEYASQANRQLEPYFQKANVHYPPKKLAILTFKREKRMEIWAPSRFGEWKHIKNYPLLATSGGPGPKLLENDHQIPEGIYKIAFLDPFSRLHLSMKIDYPNQYDRYHAKLDGRTHLGGDIFIHGKNLSIGCLAIGDRAIEELFVLVARVGVHNTEVVIAPNDLRYELPAALPYKHPKWVTDLDEKIGGELLKFKS